MGWFRRTLFHFLRLIGAFRIAQHFTRKQLRILCYHGFSITDEHVLRPYVFMRPQTFARRMQILRKRGVAVVSLDEGIARLRENRLANAETVITFDDGWRSNLEVIPLLHEFGYPACIYVTTEHLSATTEAFNVSVAYLVHASRKESVVVHGLHPAIDGTYRIKEDPDGVTSSLLSAAGRIHSLGERQRLLAPLAQCLGIDYQKFIRDGRLQFLDAQQIKDVSEQGISIQMHTHTHRLPEDSFDAMSEEIIRNRDAIADLTGVTPVHFCYPSGEHAKCHPEWLARLAIVSATTCEAGCNDGRTSLLLLNRYLDSESTSDIEFEAEIAGVRELLRRARRMIRVGTPPSRSGQAIPQ
jgi:peptidoglycan/xylan/chitin deacetylase (PgdA/CDA1 family)